MSRKQKNINNDTGIELRTFRKTITQASAQNTPDATAEAVNKAELESITEAAKIAAIKIAGKSVAQEAAAKAAKIAAIKADEIAAAALPHEPTISEPKSKGVSASKEIEARLNNVINSREYNASEIHSLSTPELARYVALSAKKESIFEQYESQIDRTLNNLKTPQEQDRFIAELAEITRDHPLKEKYKTKHASTRHRLSKERGQTPTTPKVHSSYTPKQSLPGDTTQEPKPIAAPTTPSSKQTPFHEQASLPQPKPYLTTPAHAPNLASGSIQEEEVARKLEEEELERTARLYILEKAEKKDSTRGADFEKLKAENKLDLKNISPIEEKDEHGNTKKTFKNEDTEVALTNKFNYSPPFNRIRDVNIDVKKAPAIVSLDMSDTNGRRLKGEQLVIEYGEDGKVKATIPDFSLVKTFRPDPSKPPIAYMEVDGRQVILPINGEKVEAMQKEIAEHRTQNRKTKTHAALLAKEEGIPTPNLDIAKNRLVRNEVATTEDIQKEYTDLLLENYGLKIKSEMSPSDAGAKQKLAESDKNLSKYHQLHTEGPSVDAAQQETNLAAMMAAREAAEKKFKDNAAKKLASAIQAEIEAGVNNDQVGIASAVKLEQKAKAELRAAGASPEEISKIEKDTINNSLSKAVEAQITERITGKDPLNSVLQQNQALLVGANMGVPREEMNKTIAERAARKAGEDPKDPALQAAAERTAGNANRELFAAKTVADHMARTTKTADKTRVSPSTAARSQNKSQHTGASR